MVSQVLPRRLAAPGLAACGTPILAALLHFTTVQAQSAPAPASAPATSTAQTAAITPTAVPAARSNALRLQYCSVLDEYRPFKEQTLNPWQQTNAAVLEAGGWREIAKDARTADAQRPRDDRCPPGVAAAHGSKP